MYSTEVQYSLQMGWNMKQLQLQTVLHLRKIIATLGPRVQALFSWGRRHCIKMFDPYTLLDDYGKTLVTIGALFIAFHAPSWIRGWYRSRFEHDIPTVKVEAPSVSVIPACRWILCLPHQFQASSPQYTARIIRDASITAHLDDPTLLPAGADTERFKYLTCYDPATGVSFLACFRGLGLTFHQYHIETIQLPTTEELAATIERAHAAFPDYKKTTIAQRRRLMRTLKAWFLENMEDIVRVGVRDTGKTGSYGLTSCTHSILADRRSRFQRSMRRSEKSSLPVPRSTIFSSMVKPRSHPRLVRRIFCWLTRCPR